MINHDPISRLGKYNNLKKIMTLVNFIMQFEMFYFKKRPLVNQLRNLAFTKSLTLIILFITSQSRMIMKDKKTSFGGFMIFTTTNCKNNKYKWYISFLFQTLWAYREFRFLDTFVRLIVTELILLMLKSLYDINTYIAVKRRW